MSFNVLQKPDSCSPCSLSDLGKGFTRTEGKNSLGVMIVGESSGDHERDAGLPFRPWAPAGSMLERCFKMAGKERDQFVLSNLIRCQPPNNYLDGASYEISSIEHCHKHHFAQVVEQFKPRAFLALGNLPLRVLTGMGGYKQSISLVRGFVIDSTRYPGIPVIASHHPSFLARGKSALMRVLANDIITACRVASEGYSRPQFRVIDRPTREMMERFEAECDAHPELLLTYDIETTESMSYDEGEIKANEAGWVTVTQSADPDLNDDELEGDVLSPGKVPKMDEAKPREMILQQRTVIEQIQFSLRDDLALVMPWEEPYISFAIRLLKRRNRKGTFNGWIFDDPLLMHDFRNRGIGADFMIEGERHDFMWAWHSLQPDLPRGLQFATSFYDWTFKPWKHMAQANSNWYGACDVISLQKIGSKIFGEMYQNGVWPSYFRHVMTLQKQLENASRRGIPVDEKRQQELDVEITITEKELMREINARVPREILSVKPEEGYSNPNLVEKRKALPNQGLEEGETWEEREFEVETYGTEPCGCTASSLELGLGAVPLKKCKSCKGTGVRKSKEKSVQRVVRWCRVQDFKPNSAQQLIRYMKAKGHPVPKDRKRDKDTTGKAELVRLARKTGDTFYLKSIEVREIRKIRATYIKGWAPGADGCVHTTFTNAPATGQLSSVRPNVQNAPRKGNLAKKFRMTIVAKPNKRLVKADFSSFHALTLGFNARDLNYMRLARNDIHSYVAGHFLKLPGRDRWLALPDDELKAQLNWVKTNHKSVRDDKAKPTILGYGFGLGAMHLWEMNQEHIRDKKEAQGLIDLLNALFPLTAKFRDDIRDIARDRGHLLSAHGYIRYFSDVWYWKRMAPNYSPKPGEKCFVGKDGNVYKKTYGEDSEKAIAFLPANDAFGRIKEAMLALAGHDITRDDLRVSGEDLMEKFGFVNQIHDELFFHCPNEHVEECVWKVQKEMERPSLVLKHDVVAPGGLVCRAEVSVSDLDMGDWANMLEWKKDDPWRKVAEESGRGEKVRVA